MAVILGMAAIGAWAVITERLTYVVTEGISMNPVYYQGDLVFVTKADSYHVGEIAAYHGSSPGQRVLHRIIGGDGSSGFVLKGDNNQSVDTPTPTTEEMIGRAALHVPHGGIWLKPLLSPSGLGTLSFLVISGGAAAARNRREIPRGRRKKKVKAMSRQGGSLETAAAVLKAVHRLSPLLRGASYIAAALTLLALLLGILGWMKPIVENRRIAAPPSQSITYSYSAKVPKSAAYDDTTVTSPEPVFRRLADNVDLLTTYKGPAGIFDLSARLTNGTGWHTTLQLVDKRAFTDSVYEATAKFDLKSLVARADAASKAIGMASTGTVSVALTARVVSPGIGSIAAPLTFEVTPMQMMLSGNSKLTTSSSGSASTAVVPREIGILGLTASQARSYAILSLIAAGAITAIVFLLSRRAMPLRTRAQIERRYPQLLVHVEPMPSPPGKPVVNVDNFPALVKLAEKYGQMILTWRREDSDDFVVRDEGITYRYRVPIGQPELLDIEHQNRPTTAGNHRRKASSPVT
ncbi:signal peptidase I [Actinoplanes sp. NPDC049596]|uniref:signal peptidase I n=1 Tax=unclassified Actinoplanes TaxID=2626549 RepID=UPI00343B2FE6